MGQGKQTALGRGAHRMAGAAHPLQKGGNAPRRAQLTHQVHIADVDAQFQGGGGHQRPQLAALEALLGVEAVFPRQAAVVGGDELFADALGEMTRRPFRQAAGVDEDQGGAVFIDQLFETVVDLRPYLVGHHRLQRRAGHLDGEVAVAHMAGVDDGAVGI